MKRCKLFFLISLTPFWALAQKDSIYKLQEVKIEANRLSSFSIGNKIETIDTNILKVSYPNNLAELLSRHSQVVIKSYSPGGLSIPSFRGTGATNTAILWNGFNLQSPMNGLQDLSLFPLTFVDNISLQYGTSAALYGSGAIGGAIHLNNYAVFNEGLRVGINQSLGSFGHNQKGLSVNLSKERFVTGIKVFHHKVKNNFSFINTLQPDSPLMRQQNGEITQYGLLTENYLKVNERQQIAVRLWYQNNDRNIPRGMTEETDSTNQQDNFYRATIEWKRTGDKVSYYARSGFFYQTLNYKDPEIKLVSVHTSKSFINEAEAKIALNENQLLNIGLNNTYNQAISTGYQNIPEMNRSAIFSSYKISNKKNTLTGIASLRYELAERATPLIPTVGFETQLINALKVYGNISRSYRLPTFNDLYWYPGGNPALKPESGWSEEIGLKANYRIKSITAEFTAAAFNSHIENWISWLPNTSYWSPQNIMEVWSRGTETKTFVTIPYREVKFQLSVMTSYVLSTNEEVKSENDASLHRQLIYIPRYTGQGNFLIIYKELYINYNQTYTGYRFTSTDNSQYLEPYSLGNIAVSKGLRLNKIDLRVSGQINNVWNTTYVIIPSRPLPMRNYQVGVSINFKHKNQFN